MKKDFKTKFLEILCSIILSVNMVSCNYLDVMPLETVGYDDILKTQVDVLKYLYGCYGPMQGDEKVPPLQIYSLRFGSDECVAGPTVDVTFQRKQWNLISGVTADDNNYKVPWDNYYDAIGYCNLFIRDVNNANIPDLSDVEKEQYLAEAKLLKAYYHYRAMMQFGPIPIMDEVPDRNTLPESFPGRSHFDYCAEYVARLCNEAYPFLPDKYSNQQYYGRVTKAIAKMLVAKVRLLAASPLWNGEFPAASWTNENYETPGYGKELVSHVYDPVKWEMARQACLDAIAEADAAKHELFDLDGSEELRKREIDHLPQIPGVDINTPEGEEFAKRVVLMRYVPISGPTEGSTEFIWGMLNIAPNIDNVSLPHYILTDQKGLTQGGWGWLSPSLYTMEHYYTKAGKLPEDDVEFSSESEWFTSAGLENPDIIKLFVNREPRFYANVGFDGDEYSPVIVNGSPLILRMRDSNENGYNLSLGTNNQSLTGFVNKKMVHPNIRYTGIDGNNNQSLGYDHVFPIFRLAELYLMLAECDAHLGEHKEEALLYLNKVRGRAGIPELEVDDVANFDELLKIVKEERFIEFYMEGLRLEDIVRYVEGDKYMNRNSYQGLNAMIKNPSFETFNQVVNIDQPFAWDDRMYLLPIPNSELYSNPQLVQAPFY